MTISLSKTCIPIITVFTLFLSGCTASAPSRFYLMNPIYAKSQTKMQSNDPGCISLGIGPIELPQYLNRPQIITRISENEIEISDFDKWAEPLDDNISRVLVENLNALLEPDSFTVHPWKGAMNQDYRIAVKIISFEGNLSENASLVALWNIFENKTRSLLTTRRVEYSEPVHEHNFKGLVRAQEKMLGALSEDIARDIRSVAPQNNMGRSYKD